MSVTPGYITVPLEVIPTDVTLPYAIHIRIGEHQVLLRNRGDQLGGERLNQLREKGVEALYINHDHWTAFQTGLQEELEKLGKDPSAESTMVGVRNVLYSYWRTIEEERAISPSLFQNLRELCSKFPFAIKSNRVLAHRLIRRYKDPSLYFANHSINTTIYSVAIGLKYGLGLVDLQELALAACVANIGIIKIPVPILYKPTRLTPDEWSVMREHPELGSTLLRTLLAPPALAAATLEHHERMDGNGYPRGKKGTDISLFARIISAGEVYNALTSVRPWAAPVLGPEATQMMQKMVGKFDPKILVLEP